MVSNSLFLLHRNTCHISQNHDLDVFFTQSFIQFFYLNAISVNMVEQSYFFPSYLRVLSEWRVVLCQQHGSCFTQHSLQQHLLKQHSLKQHDRVLIKEHPNFQSVAYNLDDIVQPPDGTVEINSLPTVLGFMCHIEQCNYRSRNTDCMRQHYNQEHGWRKSHGIMPWHQAHFQTLFSRRQEIHYFAVIRAHSLSAPRPSIHPFPPYIYPYANAPDNAPEYHAAPPTTTTNHPPSLETLLEEYHASQHQNSHPRTIPDSQHVSEMTPWLRTTGIHTHLAGLDLDTIGDLY